MATGVRVARASCACTAGRPGGGRRCLREEAVVEDSNEADDLRPAGLGEGGPRAEGARGDVGELDRREAQVRRVARPLVARARRDHVQGGEHGDAPVLDLHLLPAAELDGIVADEVERVPHAEGARRPDVARPDRRHRHSARARRGDDRLIGRRSGGASEQQQLGHHDVRPVRGGPGRVRGLVAEEWRTRPPDRLRAPTARHAASACAGANGGRRSHPPAPLCGGAARPPRAHARLRAAGCGCERAGAADPPGDALRRPRARAGGRDQGRPEEILVSDANCALAGDAHPTSSRPLISQSYFSKAFGAVVVVLRLSTRGAVT